MEIEHFLNYLRFECNRSLQTVSAYSDDLRSFETYFHAISDCIEWQTIDEDIIRGWLESMMDKGNNPASINRRLSALRSFYRYALINSLVNKDPTRSIKCIKCPKKLPQFLSEKEMDTLIDDNLCKKDNEEDNKKSLSRARARTILLLFYETGIRLSELVYMDTNAIDFYNKQIKVKGKGNKERVIPFGLEMESVLKDYLNIRAKHCKCTENALFLTKKGERMNADQVRYEVKKNISLVSTLKKRSPHVLRHTFATAMLNNGANIESVRKLLGHESIKTTEIYTHATFEQLKKAYKHAHPRA